MKPFPEAMASTGSSQVPSGIAGDTAAMLAAGSCPSKYSNDAKTESSDDGNQKGSITWSSQPLFPVPFMITSPRVDIVPETQTSTACGSGGNSAGPNSLDNVSPIRPN